MKKRILIVLGILIIGGGVAAGTCYKLGVFGQESSSGDAAYVTKISDLSEENSGTVNKYAGVVEPQETVYVKLESGRSVKEVQVKTGETVKKGQLLFEYDLSSIQESLEEAQLELERLQNEATTLEEENATLEKEKKQASSDKQLSYTIEIKTNELSIKKNEYNQKTKQAEIEKLQKATTDTEVRSTIDGVIQKIDTSKLTSDDNSTVDDSSSDSSSSDDGSSDAFITILSTGAYRIKGTVNELNISEIVEGDPVIIRSRADTTQTWKGTMGTVDKKSASTNSNSSIYGTDTSDSQTSTSTYPFYVNLESSDGLMLGQHVYIEMDNGQDEEKSGVWISEAYIVDADTESPYVWAADQNNKLEKRSVVLGQYDETLGEYEIADGLDEDDRIAYPSVLLEEGMATTTNQDEAIDTSQDTDSEDITADDYAADPDSAESIDDGVAEYSVDDNGEVIDDPTASSDTSVDDGTTDGSETEIVDDSGSSDTVDTSDGMTDEELVPAS